MRGDCERIHFTLRCPVAVLGDGVSGRSAARLARSLGAEVQIYDEQGLSFGSRDAAHAKVVVTSPGFHKNHPWINAAKKTGCAVVNELDFAAAAWRGKIIGVTGSNGKTTSTSFLTEVLQAAGIEAVATGNIGYPLSAAVLEYDSANAVAVCEVSSFQAESMDFLRPSSVLWTSFSEDHLDRHSDLLEYFEAKATLARRVPSNRLFLGRGVSEAAASLGRPYLKGFQWDRNGESTGEGIPSGSPFCLGPQRGNYFLVRAFCREIGLPDSLVESVAADFSLPGHRFSQPIKVADVSFWNDSKATNFGAAFAACRHFSEKATWIGGGQSKGGDLAAFCDRIKDVIDSACLIGSSAPDMLRHFARTGTPARVFSSLKDAVKASFGEAAQKGNVLFSPGFSSFDQFSGYEDRGKCFERAVLDLKKLGEPLNRPTMA
tara:strand:- start:96 stop:1391 length:1296 start_codon:yes stop_codon:yes gene_type:complete